MDEVQRTLSITDDASSVETYVKRSVTVGSARWSHAVVMPGHVEDDEARKMAKPLLDDWERDLQEREAVLNSIKKNQDEPRR